MAPGSDPEAGGGVGRLAVAGPAAVVVESLSKLSTLGQNLSLSCLCLGLWSQVLGNLDHGAVDGVDCRVGSAAEAVAAGVEIQYCGGPCCSPSF